MDILYSCFRRYSATNNKPSGMAFVLFLSGLLASDGAMAFQTEVSLTKLRASDSGKYFFGDSYEITANGGAISLDYAFSDIDDDSVYAERRFVDPQSHISFSYTDRPFFRYPDGYQQLTGDGTALYTTGGNAYFGSHDIFIGGEYSEYRAPDDKVKNYLIRAGWYPVKKLRLMLAGESLDSGDDDSLEAVIVSIQHLLELPAGYAVKNAFEYRNLNKMDSYAMAYDGAFYFNKKTSISFGLEGIGPENNSKEFEEKYRLGAEYFFTGKVSTRIDYEYASLKFYGKEENEIRCAKISISGYF
ncbi:MAG TPA: hypothetical protein VIN71_11475 [Pseudomonadales bacterium]